MGGADDCVSAAAEGFASEVAPKSMLGRILMSKLRLRAVLVMHMVLVVDLNSGGVRLIGCLKEEGYYLFDFWCGCGVEELDRKSVV